MKPGRIYRHPNCLDVDMAVLDVSDVGAGCYKFYVAWVSQRNHELVHSLDEVVMSREQREQWKEVPHSNQSTRDERNEQQRSEPKEEMTR